MIRVLMVDSVCFICDKYAAALSAQPDIEVIGCMNSLMEALVAFEGCDLLIASTNLPDDGAYKLTRTISRAGSCPQVLILGPFEAKAAIVRYMEAGALGYLHQEAPFDELLKHIRCANRGEAHLPPEITAALIARLCELSAWLEEVRPEANPAFNLTRREKEVLFLIGRDFTNQDIANHLIIEVGTVKNHVHNILAKLKVNSRREAAAYLSMFRDQPFSRLTFGQSVHAEQFLQPVQ